MDTAEPKTTYSFTHKVLIVVGMALVGILSNSLQTAFFVANADIFNGLSPVVFSMICTVLTAVWLICIAVLVSHKPGLSSWVPTAFLVTTGIGVALLFCAFLFASPLVIPALIMLSCGIALGFLFWLVLTARVSLQDALIILIVFRILSACGALLMKTLSFQTEWLVALVVIYIASVALVKTVLNQDARNSFVVSSQTNVDLFSIKTIIKDLWEPILFVSLLGFSSGTMRAFFQPDNALSSSLIIFFSTLAGVLVFYLFIVLQERSKKATDTLIIKLAVLLGITLLYLSLPFVDQKFWVIYAGVVDLCYVAGSMIMNWLCVKESQDIPVRAIIVLGVFKGTVFLSIALGFIANNTLGMLVQENTTLSFVLSLMGVYIILLTTVVVVLRRLRLALATSNTQNSQILVNMTEDQLRNNKELQDTYGITGREMDVLVLAVAGYNISGIGKQLYISENTVKTYLKRIYTKLDVHSRDDLRTFVTSLTKTA